MKTPPLVERVWYSLKEVAAKFGVSYDSVSDAVRAGSIPSILFGGQYRIPCLWVDSLPQKTILEFQKGGVR